MKIKEVKRYEFDGTLYKTKEEAEMAMEVSKLEYRLIISADPYISDGAVQYMSTYSIPLKLHSVYANVNSKVVENLIYTFENIFSAGRKPNVWIEEQQGYAKSVSIFLTNKKVETPDSEVLDTAYLYGQYNQNSLELLVKDYIKKIIP